MQVFPKISIITPTYNQGKFIEDTILSILGQNYPNLEYIIIDGGSTDETVDIIKKYSDRISYWVSEKDNGQSHAINKGFALATGDVLAWLNSDDMYMPGALDYIGQCFSDGGDKLCFGEALHYKQSGDAIVAWGSCTSAYANKSKLENVDYIIQPSTFWTKGVWEIVGELREDLHYAFDWEWFLRAKSKNVDLRPLSARPLSIYRIHEEHKTGTGGEKRQEEIYTVYKMYSAFYAELYAKVREAKRHKKPLSERIVGRISRMLNRPKNEVEVMKLLNSKEYQAYTIDEISSCIGML